MDGGEKAKATVSHKGHRNRQHDPAQTMSHQRFHTRQQQQHLCSPSTRHKPARPRRVLPIDQYLILAHQNFPILLVPSLTPLLTAPCPIPFTSPYSCPPPITALHYTTKKTRRSPNPDRESSLVIDNIRHFCTVRI